MDSQLGSGCSWGEGVSVSSGIRTKYHRPGGLQWQTQIFFYSSGGQEVQKQGPCRFCPWWGLLYWLAHSHLLNGSPCDKECKFRSLFLFLQGNYPGGSTLMTHQYLLYLPEALPPNLITSWVRTSTCKIGEVEKRKCYSLSPVMFNSLWPMDCSPPDSSVHGIFQARVLERFAILFSRGSSQPRDRTWVSCIAGKVGDTQTFSSCRGWPAVQTKTTHPTATCPEDCLGEDEPPLPPGTSGYGNRVLCEWAPSS